MEHPIYEPSQNKEIILYGTPWCGMIAPVRSTLDRTGASYQYINISQDAEAQQRVREINGGFESVPTLVFPDGSTLTEPTGHELEEKLAALGLQVQPLTGKHRLALLLENLPLRFVAIALALAGLLGRVPWLLALGIALLLLVLVTGWWRRRNA
jgi:mycoredoxin